MRAPGGIVWALGATRLNPVPLMLALRRHGPHFGAALAAAARRYGSSTALVDDHGAVSYDWLWNAAVAASGGFQAGQHVRLGCGDDRWLIVGVAAACLAGAHVTLEAPGTDGTLDSVAVSDLTGVPARGRCRSSLTFLTTGTTGAPKAVPRSRLRSSQALSLASLLAALALRRGEPVLVLPPLFHGHGFSVTASCLLVGAPVVLGRGSTAVALARTHGIRTVVGVPAQLQAFADQDTPSVQRFASGSARLSPSLAADLLRRAEVIDFFGSTETGTATIATSRDVALGSVGRPAAGVRVRIVDGWVEVCSPLAFRPGFQRTGDRGSLKRGRLFLTGRADGVTVIGGENVSATRLRDFVCDLPEVEDAKVTLVPDERLGSVFALRVALGSPLEPEALRALIAKALGRAYVPATIEWESAVAMSAGR